MIKGPRIAVEIELQHLANDLPKTVKHYLLLLPYAFLFLFVSKDNRHLPKGSETDSVAVIV
ncbi:MAG: hypothetical protein M3Z24_06670 [Chloroflexota bacterium]|nr:hypothetical protein [Chloroflexota bacterium]